MPWNALCMEKIFKYNRLDFHLHCCSQTSCYCIYFLLYLILIYVTFDKAWSHFTFTLQTWSSWFIYSYSFLPFTPPPCPYIYVILFSSASFIPHSMLYYDDRISGHSIRSQISILLCSLYILLHPSLVDLLSTSDFYTHSSKTYETKKCKNIHLVLEVGGSFLCVANSGGVWRLNDCWYGSLHCC